MPHASCTTSRISPVNQLKDYHQSSTLPASTLENAEEESLTVTAESTAVTALVAEAEGPSQSADPEAVRAEVAHQGYRNTWVSVTILKHHQGREAEHICSFDVTDPTFEKEILSELVAYEEEDEIGIVENDESLPKF